jgi:hypothetical protein
MLALPRNNSRREAGSTFAKKASIFHTKVESNEMQSMLGVLSMVKSFLSTRKSIQSSRDSQYMLGGLSTVMRVLTLYALDWTELLGNCI